MKTILHYGLSDNLGGIETYINMLYSAIHGEEYIFDFLVTDGITPAYYEEFLKKGSTFHWVTPRSENPVKNYRDLHRIFQKHQFDVLHCHLNTLSYTTPIIIAKKYNTPIIIQSHNSFMGNKFITKILHKINKNRINGNNIKKIAVSEKAGDWLFKDSDYKIINNGIDVDNFKYSNQDRVRIRSEFGLAENDYVVIHVGAFREEKNHSYLLDSFIKFNKTADGTKLLLVGEGPLKKETEEYVNQLGLKEKIIFTGNRNDVASLFSASDLFLLPSIFEGFPIVAMEAQATGIDMIISSRVTDEVKVNNNCIFIDIDDDNSKGIWVEQMMKFYKENLSEKRRELAYKNIIKANLTQEDTTKRVLELYQNTLEL